MTPKSTAMKPLLMFGDSSSSNLESLIGVHQMHLKKRTSIPVSTAPNKASQIGMLALPPSELTDGRGTTPQENPLLQIDGYNSFADHFLQTNTM